ncbi:MAG TPA: nucleoside transporter C-terminal domain-containing protein [Acidobacteriota bacterium]
MILAQSLIGLALLLGLAWAVSENRRAVPLRTVGAGLLLQLAIAVLLLRVPLLRQTFLAANAAVAAIQQATEAGTSFVFGYLGGAALPFEKAYPVSTLIFAVQVLPMVLVVAALSALLYYWKILPRIVQGFSWVLDRTLGVSGAAGTSCAASVFFGLMEAPLLIRPYLQQLSRSDLFLIMTASMATISGAVMVLFATFLQGIVPNPIVHILTASLMNAPAAIVISRLMVPGAAPDGAAPRERFVLPPSAASSFMGAITRGTLEAMPLLLNIVAMLVVLIALVSLVNQGLALLPQIGGEPLALQRLMGWVMAPIAWCMGVPWSEAATAGSLMGIKTVLNEFIAYLALRDLGAEALSERSRVILTYGLCGFANFGSLGMLLGGLSAIIPDRQRELVALGLRSVAAGTLANCVTACVVGLVY